MPNAPVPPPFVEPVANPNWVHERSLSSGLKTLLDDPRFAQVGVALVDLTHRSMAPAPSVGMAYAGLHDDRQIFCGSLPKIAVMLAAYRLRERVRNAAVALGLHEAGALFPLLAEAWKPALAAKASGRPVMVPLLDQIFVTGGFGDIQDPQFLETFYDHIALMVEGVGKNSAAAYCVQRMGFAYINGVLQAEGLQVGSTDGSVRGLSLRLDYGGNSWGGGSSGAVSQGATAMAVAAFFAALSRHQLVDEEASKDMENHLLGAVSWFGDGLKTAKRSPSNVIAKIGVAGTWSEGAIIERHMPGSGFARYAAVVLGAASYPLLWRAVTDLDILMQARLSIRAGRR